MSQTHPDEATIIKQIRETHKPDGRNINVGSTFDVVHNILSSQTATGKTMEEQLHQPDHDTMEILFKIKELSYQMTSKWSRDGDVHGMTINLLNMLSPYEWEAKAVMILAAFANNHGDQCILSKVSNRNGLAKRVWLLKQISGTKTTSESDVESSIKSFLKLTKIMLELKECPPQFIPQYLHSDLQPKAIAHITQAVLVWASQLNTSGSKTPAEPLKLLKELQDTLNDCHKKIEEKEIQESYEALKLAFSGTDHSDNKHVLKLMFNVKDEQKIMPLKNGETKAEVKVDDLQTDNNVLLLISSGLDISKERAAYLGKVYKDYHPQGHEMIWIPVVNAPNKFWTAEKMNEFESLRALMGFYAVNDPRQSVGPGVYKYVEEDLFQAGEKDLFRICKEPIVVVLDYKGNFVHKNAMGMILAWGADASPFDTYKEECLWRVETWGTALVAGTIDPIRQWINASTTQGVGKNFIFLYGGNNIEWAREFNAKVKSSLSSDIEPKMIYVGKNKEVRSKLGPSESLDGPSTWLFWARLKSMLLSRIYYLKKTSSKDANDEIVKGLKSLLAHEAPAEIGGWSLLCTKDKVVRCGDGEKMLKVMTDYETWKGNVKDKDFHEAFDEYYRNFSFTPQHQHCCGLEYPYELESTIIPFISIIPEKEKCPDCSTDMYKLITFLCCHQHDDYDVEEEREDDAISK
ncbi:PREDICTED: protein SIEVE ELEMENT OCCLUSION B-like isoform X2 [Ipomoea nil]|uniref:protein SIEVE ELEMENT OCCLUSION B-like isoform X2 n=1 Tax=Ipomoea nil TaxID=35883 RepID=UPI000900A647|nr:PREDICTED: protein SIEVE ELEMENT OCCLUSION B-like isoform X2 [Ipomoea nil]